MRPICSSCGKSNVGHLCHYEEPSWISSEDLLKHAKPVAAGGAAGTTTGIVKTPGADADSPASVDLPPSVQNKIESLKDKIKQLEASIAVTELSRSTPSVFNNSYQGPVPIQLPQPQHPFGAPSPARTQQPHQHHQNQYQAQPQPFFSHQVLPPATFQPSNSTLANVPPISELSKYENDLNDKVPFFDYLPFIIKKRRLESHGPSSVLSILRKDNYLEILWTHIWKVLEQAKEKAFTNGNPASQEGCPLSSGMDPLSTDSSKSSLIYKELKKQKISQKVQRLNTLGSKTIDQVILDVLPSRRIMTFLCFRFFKFVYPFLPFLDENAFFFEIDGIIGKLGFKDVKVEKLTFQNKYDYAIMGILLIVLKLAHLSISEEEFQENEDLRDLKDFKFDPALISAAHLCLDQYKFWRKPFSLRVMQLLLYIKCYYRYCDEDDDVTDGGESQIMLGTLFSSAFAIGLHRDPDELTSFAKPAKRKSHAMLWRRIWHKLLEMDASQSMTLGVPLHVLDDRCYDTQLPFDEGFEDDTDTCLNKDFKFIDEKNQIFRDIYKIIGNIRDPPSVLDLMHLLRKLENFTHFKIGTLKEILSGDLLPNFARIKKICYLFEVTSVGLYLNITLFHHFEKQRNTKRAYKHLEEALCISLRIVNTAMNLAFNEEIYVGRGFAFYFRANAANGIFRAFFALSAIALRILQAKAILRDTDPQRCNLFKDFQDVIFSNLENTLQLLTKMSASHYNFSRIVTAFRMIYHNMKDPNFDFDKAGLDLLTNTSGDNNIFHNHLKTITLDRLPSNNFLLDLVDTEVLKLIETSKSNLAIVLQPAIRRNDNSNNTFNQPYNPSGTGRGQFYDPVDGFTKKSTISTDSSPFDLSPSAINQSNIFNIDDLTKLSAPPTMEESQRVTNTYRDTNLLSSEEYASLFGIFDDYGSTNEIGGTTRFQV